MLLKFVGSKLFYHLQGDTKDAENDDSWSAEGHSQFEQASEVSRVKYNFFFVWVFSLARILVYVWLCFYQKEARSEQDYVS